jgi:hypothetical protein
MQHTNESLKILIARAKELKAQQLDALAVELKLAQDQAARIAEEIDRVRTRDPSTILEMDRQAKDYELSRESEPERISLTMAQFNDSLLTCKKRGAERASTFVFFGMLIAAVPVGLFGHRIEPEQVFYAAAVWATMLCLFAGAGSE